MTPKSKFRNMAKISMAEMKKKRIQTVLLLSEILVESIKVGSLRLALGLYLIGKQNTPTRASWRVNQNNENTVHMIFKDKTAMISVPLKAKAIVR